MIETAWVARSRPTAINTILQEVRALEADGKTILSLMRGQPDTPTPTHIVEAAFRALRDGRTGYPDNQGEPGLRRAVAEKLARDQGLHYDPDSEILITDGATCGIALALAALIQPGNEVLLPDPIYDAYLSPIALWGSGAVRVPASICAGRFMFDQAALEASYNPRVKVLLLNSPWNPVGTVLTRTELQAIMDFACNRNLFVISDEIYEALVYDGREHVSPASLSSQARQRRWPWRPTLRNSRRTVDGPSWRGCGRSPHCWQVRMRLLPGTTSVMGALPGCAIGFALAARRRL